MLIIIKKDSAQVADEICWHGAIIRLLSPYSTNSREYKNRRESQEKPLDSYGGVPLVPIMCLIGGGGEGVSLSGTRDPVKPAAPPCYVIWKWRTERHWRKCSGGLCVGRWFVPGHMRQPTTRGHCIAQCHPVDSLAGDYASSVLYEFASITKSEGHSGA